MPRVKLVQYALGYSHARRGVSAVDVGHFQFPLSREVALKVPAEGLGEHRFSTADGAGNDGSCSAFRGGYIGKLGGQFTLCLLSSHQFFWDEIKIQTLWVGDDEPSADSVQVVHHIKGMLMSTVLKDVVLNRGFKPASLGFQEPVQGISSN